MSNVRDLNYAELWEEFRKAREYVQELRMEIFRRDSEICKCGTETEKGISTKLNESPDAAIAAGAGAASKKDEKIESSPSENV